MQPEATFVLSELARARQQAMLPALLTAVRARRRRRLAVRAAAALVGAALASFLVWPRGATSSPAVGPVIEPVVAVQFVRDDPGVLARCEVPTTVRAEWFVDDVGLQDLLAGADRPAGFVRANGKVVVAAAAVDPWPDAP